MNNTKIYDRIAGGNIVYPPFKYPFMVSLTYKGSPECGGTLISPNKIITAAHCTVLDIKGWKATVHRQDLSKTTTQENGMTFQILKRRFHPNFNKDTSDSDVAVWTIWGKVYAPYYPILDGGIQANSVGNVLSVIGWGSSVYRGEPSSELKEVSVPIVDIRTCQSNYFQKSTYISPKFQLCAGYQEGGKDACTNDSGGPAFVPTNSGATIVGITSFGNYCALPNFPGVYASIAAVRDWIIYQMYN
ncbi:putative trypsin-like serine protease precursor [Conidiobolus coronatus NRRL 28638]|uniref:Putative trypsin-like serine protease n=1 Tax=Conidiobolus coronatus (strain ATCC 28846 / CBS 209.66 / NRRL 28638) TaxID=796925 RepID=A0A137NUJ9_CONC2|nr:putative trypsin-like serine protease precursor [Conidiobolus coronatus NRRL 28638]|eukprot:KXN66351.1 putative trypsin-like serine protease precursor [Conidiobolus coronatus NRRL 28638]